jgi:hypothetical protein
MVASATERALGCVARRSAVGHIVIIRAHATNGRDSWRRSPSSKAAVPMSSLREPAAADAGPLRARLSPPSGCLHVGSHALRHARAGFGRARVGGRSRTGPCSRTAHRADDHGLLASARGLWLALLVRHGAGAPVPLSQDDPGDAASCRTGRRIPTCESAPQHNLQMAGDIAQTRPCREVTASASAASSAHQPSPRQCNRDRRSPCN